jgi:hypothetical protein
MHRSAVGLLAGDLVDMDNVLLPIIQTSWKLS